VITGIFRRKAGVGNHPGARLAQVRLAPRAAVVNSQGMCGRFSLTVSDIAALARAWGAEVDARLQEGWRPRYNVAPGHLAPLLRGPAGQRHLVLATFGLTGRGAAPGSTGRGAAPGHTARGATQQGKLLINARSETAARLPTFREAYAGRRAVVPADGFYEWEGPPSARRPSWFHRPDGAPLLLAAIASPGPDGQTAFAILTTASVEPVARLHDRMPVILPPEALDAWLADGPPPPLPRAGEVALAGRPVSPRVNSPSHDDPACLEAPPPPAQGTLF